MILTFIYWSIWPLWFHDADTCNQDNQQTVRWYDIQFDLSFVSLLSCGGFHLYFLLYELLDVVFLALTSKFIYKKPSYMNIEFLEMKSSYSTLSVDYIDHHSVDNRGLWRRRRRKIRNRIVGSQRWASHIGVLPLFLSFRSYGR